MRLAAAVLLGVVALTSCGSDGDGDVTGDSGRTFVRQMPSGDTVECVWIRVGSAGGLWCQRVDQ